MRWSSIRNFRENSSGSINLFVALGATVLISTIGLSVDVGHWYTTKRNMQAAADAAAMAGALEVVRGSSETEVKTLAKSAAALNGFTDPNSVFVEWPPQSGPNIGNTRFVEVVVTNPTMGFLSALIKVGPTTITARAVATTTGTNTCIYALDPGASAALDLKGTADVNLTCGAMVNSTAADSIKQVGASTLTAPSIGTAGNYSGSNFFPAAPTTGIAPADDPFAFLQPPPIGACLPMSPINSDTTVSPGNYCGGIDIQGNANVTFLPGMYIVGGSGLQIKGNTTITGSDLTFYFPPTTTGVGGNKKILFVAGTATVTLTPTLLGPYRGVLFFQDRNMPSDRSVELTGGADMEITGALYFPTASMKFAGNATGGGSHWTVTVARTIEFVGNSEMTGGIPNADLPLALSSPTLAE